MTSSIIYLKNMARIQSSGASYKPGKYTKLILSAILLMGIAVYTPGCAANKCDCPRFSGHRVGH